MSDEGRRGLAHPLTIFAGALVLLLAYNIQTLDDPPYWDGILGLFHQSAWLADNGFDYVGLVKQPGYDAGGPNLIVFYLLAPVYAGLYMILPVKGVFIVAHLMNLAFAALAIAVFYALLKERLGAGLSLLWSLALLLDPMWSGQCATIYLEIPLAAAILLSLRAFDGARYKTAAIWCLVAFFIKPSGLLLALAFAVYVALRHVFGWMFRAGEDRLEQVSRGSLWLVAVLPAAYGLSTLVTVPGLEPLPSSVVWGLIRDHAPQSLALVGLMALGALLALALRGARRRLIAQPRDLDLILLGCTLVFGFWLSFFLHSNPLVRYAVSLWPPALIVLALLSRHLLGAKRGAWIPVLFALWGAVNQYGALLPAVEPRLRRSGNYLERSREFLEDLEGNRRLCRTLEERYRGATVVVKWPFAQMLSMPRLGYVERPMPKLACTRPLANTQTQRLDSELSQRPDALFLYAPNVFEVLWSPSLRPPPGARPVLVDRACGGDLLVYALPRRR